MLRCLIDYQCNSTDAWKRGQDYFKKINPDQQRELWNIIRETPQEEWNSEANFQYCNLHRWHRAHNRLWPIADCICRYFEADARNIWKEGSTTFDVLCRLYYIGAGDQISRMIVGALKDCGQIFGTSDVKADVHVCRVLGRIFYGKEANPRTAITLCRALYPDDPWQLDGPLWNLGQSNCHDSSPLCASCYLKDYCSNFQEPSLRG